jgi:DNA polymerase-1
MFDIEGDNLLFNVTQIHCIATQDIDSGEQNFYPPNDLDAGIVALRGAEVLSGHNIIGYDLPAIWKIIGEWDETPLILDTLVVSRALLPERKGGHSLGAWGESLGYQKGEQPESWLEYTEDMGTYCQRDVGVNVKVFEALDKEMEAQYGTTLTGYKVYP